MGDEQGRQVLVPCYLCEEPSAAAGIISLRPAAACRRGKCRRLQGDLSAARLNYETIKAGHYLSGLPLGVAGRRSYTLEKMRAARRPRYALEPDPAQPSLFLGLPPAPRIQPAIRLTEANVARTVPPHSPGVYFLKSVGPQGSVGERVGRDDVDLHQRLLQHAREGQLNVLFGWMLATDANEAYQFECYLWHAQGGAWRSIEGNTHPQPADPVPFLGCPDCEE